MNVSHALSSIPENARSQVLRSFLGSPFDFNSIFGAAVSSQFTDVASTPTNLLSLFIQRSGTKSGVLHVGRNMSLSDPESAYKMMTLINNKDVLYKAQYSELHQMGAAVSRMQEAGQNLGNVTTATGNDDIKTSLQGFVNRYNDWIQRFNPDMQNGGLLSGTQAAQVSRHELEQSVKNIFNGAKDGVHGLGDLGISVDPVSQILALDSTKLNPMLASAKPGVVDTIQEFSANFAKSASLLNANNNFIPNQLDNLNRVIRYIKDNSDSLQTEFGTGDAAKPTGQVAQALAAYKQSYSF